MTGWGTPNGQTLINALAGGFTLSASPSSRTVTQGGSVATTITVTDVGGFSSDVALVASGLPAGVTATLTVTGTSGSFAKSTHILLTVRTHDGELD